MTGPAPPNQQTTPPPAEFLVTKEHRRMEFVGAVREHRYIGVCYGPPGVGKTVSARRYTSWDQLAPWARTPPLWRDH